MTPFLIALAGPSGAGKTELARHAKRHSRLFEHLPVDHYFKSPETFRTRFGLPNWETPSSLDFDLLAAHLRKLKSGKSITVKTLPVQTAKGLKRYEINIHPRQYIIVDGFLVLKDRVIRKLTDLSIYMHIPKRLMLERRRMQYGRITEYDRRIAVPEFLHHGINQVKFADYVLNGSLPIGFNYEILRNTLRDTTLKQPTELDKGTVIKSLIAQRDIERSKK